MALYLIGIGLNDEKDISVKGLEIVKKADKIYLDIYTSKMNCAVSDLEKFYGKKIIEANREMLENKSDVIVDEAKDKDVVLLVAGSPTAATTHSNFLIDGKKKNVNVKVVENASVFSAIGITGLFLYKFGQVISIPHKNENVKSPYEKFKRNNEIGLHTLFLLDVDDKLMTIREALDYLIKMGLDKDTMVVGCGALGSSDPEIKYGRASEVEINRFPQCLIIPGELHFKEEEALELYR